MISIILEHKRLVAVAVNTKQYAPSGIMLRTSPILDRVERNVVPLKLYKWIILAIHFSTINLPHFHCVCLINYYGFQSVSTFLLNEIYPLLWLFKIVSGVKNNNQYFPATTPSATSSGVLLLEDHAHPPPPPPPPPDLSSLLSNIIARIIFYPPIPIFSE